MVLLPFRGEILGTGAQSVADGSITLAKMAANSVDSDQYVDDSIDIAHLSASGTASNSTFLRGDNQWAAAGGIASLVDDTSPQVGGSAGLDLQAQLLVGNGGTTASPYLPTVKSRWQRNLVYLR